MDIKWENDFAVLNIDFKYYSYQSIVKAAGEFVDTCFVAIKNSDDFDSVFVRIEPKTSDIKLRDSVYSFLNYIVGIMQGEILATSQQ